MFDFPVFAFNDDISCVEKCSEETVILNKVRDALAANALCLAYQPAISYGPTQRVAFQEGLIRMFDASGTATPAADFIPAIENLEEGRLVDIVALKLGLQALVNDPSLRLSINLSPKSITHAGWRAALLDGLSQCPTLAERLILEITESSMIETPDLMRDFMKRLQAIGVTFALDDFGAGYTAFRHFKEFRFDIVKIDRVFVNSIVEDRCNQAIVGALKAIADQFEMVIVAEGVETLEDAQYLNSVGVTVMQGYYFARPSLAVPQASQLANAG